MDEAKDKPASIWKRELSPRGIGVVLLLCGAGFSYFGFIQPWRDVANHAPSVDLSPKAIFIAPLVLGLGLFYTLAPAWSLQVLGDPQKPTRISLALSVVLFLAGVGAYFLLNRWLADLGYTRK